MTDASIVSLYANLTFFFITLGCFASVKEIGRAHV